MPAGFPNLININWKSPESKGGIYEIDFIDGWPTAPEILLAYPEGYNFIGGYMAENYMLMTSWSAADSGVFQVFHLVPGGAKLVFQKEKWSRVETWHSTVLINQSAKGADDKYHYTNTEIWQWNGQQYTLAATVPYDQRLETLAKLEHEAKEK